MITKETAQAQLFCSNTDSAQFQYVDDYDVVVIVVINCYQNNRRPTHAAPGAGEDTQGAPCRRAKTEECRPPKSELHRQSFCQKIPHSMVFGGPMDLTIVGVSVASMHTSQSCISKGKGRQGIASFCKEPLCFNTTYALSSYALTCALLTKLYGGGREGKRKCWKQSLVNVESDETRRGLARKAHTRC